jgi:hypothetical protein
MMSGANAQRSVGASVSNEAVLSGGTCSHLADRLGTMNFGLSLTHVAIGCFKARIWRGQVAYRGRELTVPVIDRLEKMLHS